MAAGSRLVGTELELPVVRRADGMPAGPAVFEALWAALAARGWTPTEFAVSRPYPADGPSISSAQLISTDTGPVVELVTSPSSTLSRVASQMERLQAEARDALAELGCVMLALGVHPTLAPLPEDYYRYRTPRPAYDYAIAQRGWSHWSIVDKAAVQEVVDVSFADAPRAVGALHRLAGLMNFLLRNDPDVHAPVDARLSVRPQAWRDHVPTDGPFAADRARVAIPAAEIGGWRGYLELLWNSAPMFLVGTKNRGLAYVPERPTFLDYLRRAPRGGWHGRLLDGSPANVVPETAHVMATDWSYMGFARIRWKWRDDPPPVEAIVEAWERDEIEELLAGSLEKVVVENRSTSTQPRGEDLTSLALVTGLIANLDETHAFAAERPYAFWSGLLDASARLPLAAIVDGRPVADLARDLVEIARAGLLRRGEPDPDAWLAPLRQRIEDRESPSERRLRELRDGGVPALIRAAAI